MWKIVLMFMGKKKDSYVKSVRFRKKVYIIDIHEYIPAEEELKKWKNALGEPKADNQK